MLVSTTSDLLGQAARAVMDSGEPEPFAVLCDHQPDGRRQFEIHARVSTRPAKPINEGIQAVQARLRTDPATGLPALFVLRSAPVELDERLVSAGIPASMIEGMGSYTWQRDPTGVLTKDKPQPHNDQAMDAMRYAVMGVDEING